MACSLLIGGVQAYVKRVGKNSIDWTMWDERAVKIAREWRMCERALGVEVCVCNFRSDCLLLKYQRIFCSYKYRFLSSKSKKKMRKFHKNLWFFPLMKMFCSWNLSRVFSEYFLSILNIVRILCYIEKISLDSRLVISVGKWKCLGLWEDILQIHHCTCKLITHSNFQII